LTNQLARRRQTVARKAEFIAQVMRGRLDVREIDDIGDDALSFTEVKALATGNPLLLDHAAAKADVTRLERLERGHERSQARLPELITAAGDRIETLTARHEATTDALAARRPTRGEAFAMSVAGKRYTERGPAAGALAEAARTLGQQHSRTTREVTQPGLARLGGNDVTGVVTPTLGDSDPRVSLQIAGIEDTTITVRGQDYNGGTGFVTRLENQLDRLDDIQTSTTDGIEAARTEITRSQARIGEAFPHADELTTARARLADLEAQMTQATVPEDHAPEAGEAAQSPEPDASTPQPGRGPDPAERNQTTVEHAEPTQPQPYEQPEPEDSPDATNVPRGEPSLPHNEPPAPEPPARRPYGTLHAHELAQTIENTEIRLAGQHDEAEHARQTIERTAPAVEAGHGPEVSKLDEQRERLHRQATAITDLRTQQAERDQAVADTSEARRERQAAEARLAETGRFTPAGVKRDLTAARDEARQRELSAHQRTRVATEAAQARQAEAGPEHHRDQILARARAADADYDTAREAAQLRDQRDLADTRSEADELETHYQHTQQQLGALHTEADLRAALTDPQAHADQAARDEARERATPTPDMRGYAPDYGQPEAAYDPAALYIPGPEAEPTGPEPEP
jgi:hypothetical protein